MSRKLTLVSASTFCGLHFASLEIVMRKRYTKSKMTALIKQVGEHGQKA